MIWGVNLRDNNLTSAYLEARSIAKAFSSTAVKDAGVTLDFLEIGNEADGFSSVRTNWSVAEYVKE